MACCDICVIIFCFIYVHNAISDAHIIYMSITNKEEFLSWWHTAKVPQQPLAQRDLETSPKTRGAADRVSPWTYGPLIKHITRASHHIFFFQKGEVNDHRRSFPYSPVTSKQTITKEGEGAQPNAA